MSRHTEAALALIVAMVAPLVWFAVTPPFRTMAETMSDESILFFIVYGAITFGAIIWLIIEGAVRFYDYD